MKKILIGITGPARSGKDTVAGFLIEQGFQRLSFAEPLKAGVAAMLGESPEDLFSDENKDKPLRADWPQHITPRMLLQAVGTQGIRHNVDPRFWAWLAADKYAESTHSVVITDVRFEDEARWVRSQGGKIWRLVRNGTSNISGLAGHVSEAGIEPHPDDVTLHNNQSLDQLGYNVRQLLRWMNEDGR